MTTANDDACTRRSKKRTRPSSIDDGEVHGDNRARRRHASSTPRPLPLIATCALDRRDVRANQQRMRSASNMVGGGETRTIDHDAGDSPRTIGHSTPRGFGLSTQNTSPSRGTNNQMADMACVQPGGTLHRGQSHPTTAMLNPQYLLGMTPHELLNYA
jgi:hypothetical protein